MPRAWVYFLFFCVNGLTTRKTERLFAKTHSRGTTCFPPKLFADVNISRLIGLAGSTRARFSWQVLLVRVWWLKIFSLNSFRKTVNSFWTIHPWSVVFVGVLTPLRSFHDKLSLVITAQSSTHEQVLLDNFYLIMRKEWSRFSLFVICNKVIFARVNDWQASLTSFSRWLRHSPFAREQVSLDQFFIGKSPSLKAATPVSQQGDLSRTSLLSFVVQRVTQ